MSSPRPLGVVAAGDSEEAYLDSLCVSAGGCVSPHSNTPSQADSDDEFIIVADLPFHPSSASSRSTESPLVGPVLPCASPRVVSRSTQSSRRLLSAQPRLPAPALLSEFCGLPCGPVYVVWKLPACSACNPAGIHFGERAWQGILSIIPGHQYRSGQDRLRALPFSYDETELPEKGSPPTSCQRERLNLVVVIPISGVTMTSSRASTSAAAAAAAAAAEESTSMAWATATQEGHRCFRVADKLLARSWIAPCPLPVDGGGRQQATSFDDSERFTDLLVIALHWAGPPDGPPTSALLAVPEAAAHGITDAVVRQVDCAYPDGQVVDTAGVVILLASAEYLSRILSESTHAEVVNFVTDVPAAAPSGAALFAALASSEPIISTPGVWLHQDEQAAL
eukprot:6476869-Amphidinium_carterae.1